MKNINFLCIVLLAIILASLRGLTTATTTVRSVVLYPTTSKYAGRSIGNVSVTAAACLAQKPASTCTPTAPVAFLGRSSGTTNLSALAVNNTVPVIWYANNYTMADRLALLFRLRPSSYWYIRVPVTSVVGSVGANQTYWTGVGADGLYISDASSCGGNWTVNLTGNVGLTNTNDKNWLNYTQTSCETPLPYLCACDSYLTPVFLPDSVVDIGLIVGPTVGLFCGVVLFILIVAAYSGSFKNCCKKRKN